MKEDLAEQRRRLHSGLAHATGIALIDLGLEELIDEREQHFAKYLGPFFVIRRSKIVREQGSLQRAQRLVSDFPAWVQALVRKTLEDR